MRPVMNRLIVYAKRALVFIAILLIQSITLFSIFGHALVESVDIGAVVVLSFFLCAFTSFVVGLVWEKWGALVGLGLSIPSIAFLLGMLLWSDKTGDQSEMMLWYSLPISQVGANIGGALLGNRRTRHAKSKGVESGEQKRL